MLWLLAIMIILTILLRAYRNTFHPTINHVEIDVQATSVFEQALPPLKILHLSDLHMENISITAEKIVNTIQDESFDLIAITGDLLDREKNIAKARTYVETLHKSIQPKLGTFVVFGNHDYVLSPNKLAQLKGELERVGCHVLCNRSKTLDLENRVLHVIGIDDYHSGKSDLRKSFSQIGNDGIRLVLTHDPNVILTMKDYEYDYLLSGHFHGGQIHWPKPFHLMKMGKLPRMNIVKGLHYQNGRPFYISEGLGQTGLNIRLRSRPEITIHTLQGQSTPSHQAAHLQNLMSEAAPTLALE